MTYVSHNLPFGYMDMTEDHVVIVCSEGSDISYDEVTEINSVLKKRYEGKKISLIAHRLHNYSVNPAAIKKLFSEEYIREGLIVGYSKVTEMTAKLEALCVKDKPILFLPDINEAFIRIKAAV